MILFAAVTGACRGDVFGVVAGDDSDEVSPGGFGGGGGGGGIFVKFSRVIVNVPVSVHLTLFALPSTSIGCANLGVPF